MNKLEKIVLLESDITVQPWRWGGGARVAAMAVLAAVVGHSDKRQTRIHWKQSPKESQAGSMIDGLVKGSLGVP